MKMGRLPLSKDSEDDVNIEIPKIDRPPEACTVLAVDPGVTGAYAIVRRHKRSVITAMVSDTPVRPNEGLERGKETLLNISSLEEILLDPHTEIDIIVIEKLIWMRTDGATAMIAGINYGRWTAVLERLGVPLFEVYPRTWKRSMGVTSDKGNSLDLAKAIFPELSDKLTRKKDHDRAEALLLADYAYWHKWVSMMQGYQEKAMNGVGMLPRFTENSSTLWVKPTQSLPE